MNDMAYPYYQPMTYQPNVYANSPYSQQAQSAPIQQPQQTQQIQNGGFVCVRSMDEVRNWAIAPGNSITFYVESTPPIIATKTKGFSQLEMPVIKVFDLTERAQNDPKTNDTDNESKTAPYALKTDLDAIWDAINALKGDNDE